MLVEVDFSLFELLRFKEQVPNGDVNQISAAQQLHECVSQQQCSCKDRHEAKEKSQEHSNVQSSPLLVLGQAPGQKTQHQRVIDGERALQDCQKRNDRQIRPAE